MVISIQFLSYLACGAAFLFLTLLVGLSRSSGRYKNLLFAGCVATLIWSLAIVGVQWFGAWPGIVSALELLRNLAWLMLLAAFLGIWRVQDTRGIGRLSIVVVIGVTGGLFVFDSLRGVLEPFGFRLQAHQAIIGGGHVVE